MLKYVGNTEIQLLMAAMAYLLLYAGLMTVMLRRRLLLATMAMASVFAVGYVTLRASDAVIGRPVWIDGEIAGMLGGYVQFTHDGREWIAVLLKTDAGPRLIAVPHTPRDAEQVHQSMEAWIKLGVAQVVRKKADGIGADESEGREGKGGENSQQGGQLEFYEFNQDFLQPKASQPAQP